MSKRMVKTAWERPYRCKKVFKMNSFLLPRRVNVCRSHISVVLWSDRFLPPTARIAEVFAVTLVFFSTACQQKGALPACLASRGFPHYLFEHIAVSAQTCNNASFANDVLLFIFLIRRRELTRDVPQDECVPKNYQVGKAHQGDREGPRTARRYVVYER